MIWGYHYFRKHPWRQRKICKETLLAFSALRSPKSPTSCICRSAQGIPRPQHKIATDRRRTAIRCLLKGVPCFLKRPESYLLLITAMQFHNKTPISCYFSCEHLMIWDQSICLYQSREACCGPHPKHLYFKMMFDGMWKIRWNLSSIILIATP